MPDWESIRSRVYHRTNLDLQAVVAPHGISADASFATVEPPPERGLVFCVAISMRRARVTAVLGAFAANLLKAIHCAVEQERSALDALRSHYESVGLTVGFGDPLASADESNPVREALLHVEIPYHEEGFEHASGVARLSDALEAAVQLLLLTLPHADTHSAVCATEGERRTFEISRAERSPANRRACLAIHGYACKGCGELLEHKYGRIAHQMIEVHHINPIGAMDEPSAVNPRTELVPLCPNCHAVVHRTVPPMAMHELKGLADASRDEL